YGIYVDGEGRDYWWCSDYEIGLSSMARGGTANYFLVWDNAGGNYGRDGGHDDDSLNDRDILLGGGWSDPWTRTTNVFNGQPVNQTWYVSVKDTVHRSGEPTYPVGLIQWVLLVIEYEFPCDPTLPTVIYVDADAPGPTHDGSSWVNAYKYLQNALAAAGTCYEIRVAQGIYKPDHGSGITLGDLNASFQLKNGVTIKGGYAGYGAPYPYSRDIEAYKTVLSGDIGMTANFADNSYHVVTGSGCDSTAMLDGFVVFGGEASGSNPRDRGAGMYNRAGSPMIINCEFRSNSAGINGGAMWNSENSHPIVSNCTFDYNIAGSGAGMCNQDSSPTVTNCTFSWNQATSWGGAMHNDGGWPTVTNCTFSDNSARLGGGMFNQNGSEPTVTNCTFTGNSALTGGGMWNSLGGSPELVNCTFKGNSASEKGGGMYNQSDTVATVINCTFTGNSALTGGGMYNVGMGTIVSLYNCIFWGDTPDEIYKSYRQATGELVTATYSNIEGGWPDEGNINQDPLFADADGRLSAGSPCIDAGDNTAVPGGVTTDLDGNARFADDPATPDTGNGTPPIVDMGAYEFGAMPGGPPPAPTGVIAKEGNNTGEITLTWNPSPGATGYKIFYDEDTSNPPFSPTQDGIPASGSNVGNVTQVTITSLSPGETYCLAVKAYNNAGESDYSAQECGARVAPIGGVSCQPDLTVFLPALWDFTPETLNICQSSKPLEIDFGIKNTECEDSGQFRIAFYASTDQYITSSDYFLGRGRLSMASGQSSMYSTTVDMAPGDLPSGTYYIGCIIDYQNDVQEIDENNNVMVIQHKRLTIASCQVPPNCEYAPGDRVVLLVSNPRNATNLPAGTCGTVLCIDSSDPDLPILVSWDGWSDGYNRDSFCDVPPEPYPNNSAYWMPCDQIAPGCTEGPGEFSCCDLPYPPGARVRLRVSSPRGAAGLVAGMLGTVICCDYDDPDLPIFVSWDEWSNGRNSDFYCDTSVWSYPANSGTHPNTWASLPSVVTGN
ncbi:MAG: fibronectin type III domain-containing protein, partial [Planctomycetota bacterium]